MFVLDLAAHETTRVAAVMAAAEDFDPLVALEQEREAIALLHSGLDAEQTATLALLREWGLG